MIKSQSGKNLQEIFHILYNGKVRLQSLPAKHQTCIELYCKILTITLPLFIEERKVWMEEKINQHVLRTYSFLSFSHHNLTECLQCPCNYLCIINEDEVTKQMAPRLPKNKCQRPNSSQGVSESPFVSFHLLHAMEKMRKDSKVDGMFVIKYFG